LDKGCDVTTRLEVIERGTTLTAQVLQKLREALIAGVFTPGERVTMQALAAALDVSLTPVREALGILAAEGALEVSPNRTLIVANLSVERLREITEIRVSLETLAAKTAAKLLSDDEIAAAVLANDEMIRATEARDFKHAIRRNHDFHFTIYRGARMPTLLKTIEGLWLRTGAYVNLTHPVFRAMPEALENHNLAAAAVQARDGRALAKCIEADIRLSAGNLEAALKAKVEAA
jgi:DNA-binding GntR family transcriptional regulator